MELTLDSMGGRSSRANLIKIKCNDCGKIARVKLRDGLCGPCRNRMIYEHRQKRRQELPWYLREDRHGLR